MNLPGEIVSTAGANSQLATFFLDALLKSLAVLAAAGGLLLVWRRASAASRHLVWFVALAGLLLLPLLPSVSPAWPKPLWSVSANMISGNQVSLRLEFAPRPAAAISVPEAAAISTHDVPAASGPVAPDRFFAARFSQNWLAVVVVAWSAGLLFLLARLAFGQIQLYSISRGARRLQSADWVILLNESCEQLRLRRPVKLLLSAENVMPLTWGWWRPVVLFPAEAEQWPEERRRIVLLHELAHIKRWDCLTQLIARIVCAFYWFNPLAWLASQRMRVERERACDDLVLNAGCKASDYAGHLVEIARSFRRVPQTAAIAMARSSGLEKRIAAIVDASRVRTLRPLTVWAVLILAGGLIFCIGGWSAESGRSAASNDIALQQRQLDQIKKFSAAKLKQAQLLTAAAGEEISPEYQRFFDAAIRGDGQTVTNMFESFRGRVHQYEHVKGIPPDPRLETSCWGPVLEIWLAYDHVVHCDAKYTQIAVDDMIQSIPRGSIYFGGTDPGRGLPTAFSKSHADADPFYTVTQNALCDGTYLEYLRDTYGERRHWLVPLSDAVRADSKAQSLIQEYRDSCEKFVKLTSTNSPDDPIAKAAEKAYWDARSKIDERVDQVLTNLEARTDSGKKARLLTGPPPVIYTPTAKDSEDAFGDYSADAERRMRHDLQFPIDKYPNEPRQIRMGEGVEPFTENGVTRIKVYGQVAIMSINGLIAKTIFDKNPDREFFVEESFPLDWMYPHLEPHGPIMKINREPLADLSEEVVRKDHDFWQQRVNGMLGDWLTEDTPVSNVVAFVEKVYLHDDLSGFKGDPRFVRNDYAQKMFSKWRSGIAGLYCWRLGMAAGSPTAPEYLPKNKAEQERMTKAADFAFRQAYALCPYSPEALFRYINLLANPTQKRYGDALLIAETTLKLDPDLQLLPGLVQQLKSMTNEPNEVDLAQKRILQLESDLKANPNDFQKSFDLAQLYMKFNQVNRATAILDGVLNNTNATVAAVTGVAQVYAQLNNAAKLEPALEKLVKLDPNEAEYWYHLAATKALLKKPTEALQSLRRALELNDKAREKSPKAIDLRGELEKDPRFSALRELPEYKALVSPH